MGVTGAWKSIHYQNPGDSWEACYNMDFPKNGVLPRKRGENTGLSTECEIEVHVILLRSRRKGDPLGLKEPPSGRGGTFCIALFSEKVPATVFPRK